MDTKFKPKKNSIAKDLFTRKYKSSCSAKKGKGSYNRKKTKV